MPQPLRKPTQITHTPLTLHKTRKEHAALIGLVAAEWSGLEGHLSHMLSFGLFGLSTDESAVAPVIGAVFATLESINQRLALTERVLKPRVSSTLHKHFVETIAPEVRKRAKERNAVVHGYWGISPEYPDHIILSPRGGADLQYALEHEASDYCSIMRKIWRTSPSASKEPAIESPGFNFKSSTNAFPCHSCQCLDRTRTRTH